MANPKSKYYYDDVNVLKNCFNIKSKEELEQTERLITTYKIGRLELNEYPFPLSLDVNHYLLLHKYIFSDVYNFAGNIREEVIYKRNEPFYSGVTPFCYPNFIYQQLKITLDEMRHNIKNIKNTNALLSFLAHYYEELNVIHPFREGNGRTLREFLREYVLILQKILPFEVGEINYNRWTHEDREKLLQWTIHATVTGECEHLAILFSKVYCPIEITTMKRVSK